MYKLLGSFLAALALAFVSQSASAVENHWIQPSGGDWSNPVNWSLGVVPDWLDQHDVFIDAPGDYTVTITTGTTARGVKVGSTNAAVTLNVTGGLVAYGPFEVEETSTLETQLGSHLSGRVRIKGRWKYYDNSHAISGVIETNGLVEMMGTSDKTISGLRNEGTIIWNCSGNWMQSSPGSENHGEIILETNLNVDGGGYFENHGTVTVPQGLDITFSTPATDFGISQGIYVMHSGAFQAGAGATLTLQGKHVLRDGVAFEGPGTFDFDGKIGGFGTFSANSTIRVSESSRLYWAATWIGSGTLEWNGGKLFGDPRDGLGSTVISNNFTLRIGVGLNHQMVHHTITNRGTIVWEAEVLNGTNSAIYNENTFVLSSWCGLTGNGDFYNSGTIVASEGAYSNMEVLDEWILHNSGVFHAGTGAYLELFGNYLLNNGTTFNGAGNTRLSGGNFGGVGAITVNGLAELGDAILGGEHIWTGPGLLQSFGGGAFDGSTVFSNDFHFYIGGGTISLGGVITNRGMITCDDGQIDGQDGEIHNEGTLVVSFLHLLNSGNFYNSGTVIAPEGGFSYLETFGSWTFHNTGIFHADNAATLELYGNYELNTGTTFNGAGTTRLANGMFAGNGTVTVNGLAELQSGFLAGEHIWTGPGLLQSYGGGSINGITVFSNDFHVYMGGGAISAGGVITNRGMITCDDGQIDGQDGEIHNEGTLVVSFLHLLNSGNFYNSGTVIAPEGGFSYLETFGSWTFHNTGIFHAENAATLELYGNYDLNEGTTFNGAGKTRLANGFFGGNGTVTVNGLAELQSGFLAGEHIWTGPGLLQSYGGGSINGITVFSNDFQVYMGGGAISAGGVITNRGTITCQDGQIDGQNGEIHNEGTLVVSFLHLLNSGNFYNSGTVIAPEGGFSYLETFGSWTFHNTGIFHAENAATLELYGNYDLNEGTTFNGAGKTRLANGMFAGAGTVTVNGLAELQSGLLAGEHIWTGPGLLQSYGGGGFDGSTVFSNDFHVYLGGGAISVGGVITNRGTITAYDGQMDGQNGEVHNEGTLVVSFLHLSNNGNFYNSGTVLAPEGGFSYLETFGTWTFHNSGIFHAENAATLELYGNYGLNDGTTLNGPGKTALAGGNFGGSGTITVNGSAELTSTVSGEHIWTGTGELQWSAGGFSGPGSTTFDTNLVVRVDGLGSIHFNQTITNLGTVGFAGPTGIINGADFYNKGRFIIGLTGRCMFTGSSNFYNAGLYEQNGPADLSATFVNTGVMKVKSGIADILSFSSSPDAVLQFQLSGTLPGLTHGQLTVGSFNAAGRLNVTLAGGFTGNEGDAFDLITYSGVAGTFSDIVLPDTQWQSQYGNGKFVVTKGTAEAPGIPVGLQDRIVAVGTNVTWTVEASGVPVPTYQWLFEGTPIPNATLASFSLTNVQPGASGTYSVVVTNHAGSASSSAELAVLLRPMIVGHPANTSVVAGSPVTFAAAATGDYLQYQWFFGASAVPYATNSSFTLTNVQPSNAGNYYLFVQNPVGSASSSNALLTVNLPAHIIVGPQDRIAVSGSNVLFSVEAAGTGPVFYQWQHEGVVIAGATATTLQLTNVQTAAAGTYTVTVTNAYGSASGSATLTIQQTPFIITQPADLISILGSNATFTVQAGGFGALRYNWFFEGQAIASTTNASLTLTNVQSTNVGVYYVVVTNQVGSVSSSNATLAVNIPAHITAAPQDQTHISGTNVIFSVEASGTGGLFYQWQHNGNAISGATATTLSLTNVQSANGGSYVVTVTNAYGSDSASATLTVQQAPFIITQPTNQTVVLGSRATFAVEAGGDGTLGYQWFFKNDLVAGATGSTFVQEEVHASLGGGYQVVISNLYGKATSEVATLNVSYTNDPFMDAAGFYNGLFHETDAVRHQSAGYFLMTLRTNAAFTGKLLLNGNSVSFSGKFSPGGTTNKTVLRTKFGKDPVTVRLQVDFGVNQVVGTVSSSDWIADIMADRGFYNNTNLATNFCGNYTLLIPGAESSAVSPSGHGYASVIVRTNGRVSFSGYAADKQAIKQTTLISQNGDVPFFAPMYRSASNVLNGDISITNNEHRGFMFGWLSVTNGSDDSPKGTVSWIKTGWTNDLYQVGFTNETEILGSTFIIPAKGARVVQITNGITSFFDAYLAQPVSHPFTLKTNNTVLTTSRTNLSLTINSSSGVFKGTFRDPASGTNAPFFGALLQQQNMGAGFFVGTNQAGLMQLQKQ